MRFRSRLIGKEGRQNERGIVCIIVDGGGFSGRIILNVKSGQCLAALPAYPVLPYTINSYLHLRYHVKFFYK